MYDKLKSSSGRKPVHKLGKQNREQRNSGSEQPTTWDVYLTINNLSWPKPMTLHWARLTMTVFGVTQGGLVHKGKFKILKSNTLHLQFCH